MPIESHRGSAVRRRVAALVSLLSLVLLFSAALTAPTGVAATSLEKGLEKLDELKKKIEKAKDAENKVGNPYNRLIHTAIIGKFNLILTGYQGQKLFGCGASTVMHRLATIDYRATQIYVFSKGGVGPGDPQFKEALSNQLDAAEDLISELRQCGAPEAAKEQAKTIKHRVRMFQHTAHGTRESQGEHVNFPALRADKFDIYKEKLKLLRGQKVYGCDVVEYFDLIEDLDDALVYARSFTLDSAELTEKRREAALRDASTALRELTRAWRKLPCGPQCNDAWDNDGDGNTDGADTGCLTTGDTTEGTHRWTVPYPGDGMSLTAWLDFKARFKAGQAIADAAYRLFFNPTVHDSVTLNHGSVPISGAMPCAFLSGTTIRAGIGSMAPTGGVLPAPPTNDHARLVLDLTDPAGGGTCGTGTVELQIAVDTRD